jgi:hypothetical protein
MKTLRTEYKEPTNFKAARIVVTDDDGFKKTYPYDSNAKCPHISALKKAKKNWLDGNYKNKNMVVGSYGKGKIAVFLNDEII